MRRRPKSMMQTKMKKIVRAAMLFAALTMAGRGHAAAPVADGSFEQFNSNEQSKHP